MSLSKIIKTSQAVNSEPFVMERLMGAGRKHPFAPEMEEVGGDIVSLEREAYEKGFHSGEKAGFEFGSKKAEVLFSGLGGVLEEVSNFRETIFKACEKDMVELSLAIAKKVMHRELEVKKDAVLDCVRAALKSVIAGGEISIRVNPKDLDILNQYRGELARYGEGVKGVKVEGDDSIAKGGCVIETNYGEVDATMDSILADIEERLRNA